MVLATGTCAMLHKTAASAISVANCLGGVIEAGRDVLSY